MVSVSKPRYMAFFLLELDNRTDWKKLHPIEWPKVTSRKMGEKSPKIRDNREQEILLKIINVDKQGTYF